MLLALLACAPGVSSLDPDVATDVAEKMASSRFGRADPDASCGWAAVQVAVAVQRRYEGVYDAFAEALLPVADLPIPRSCADRLSVYVTTVSSRDFEVCARITTGPGEGRAFCGAYDGAVYERPELVSADPAEPSADYPPSIEVALDVGDQLSHFLDPGDRVPQVFTDRSTGRVVADLPPELVRERARVVARDLATYERAYDAAFDTYTTDLANFGIALFGLLSCSDYLAARVAEATDSISFRIEVLVVEGDRAGELYTTTNASPVHFHGWLTPDREALAADGWVMGEGLP